MNAVRAEGFGVLVDGEPLLHDATFAIPDRGLALVEGPSGSGKSTLLRALAGLLPREDAVVVGALDVLGRPFRRGPARPDDVGLVPQDPQEALLAADVLGEASFRLENLGVPEAEGLRRARAALAAVGLEKLERRESASLSGGEARRVAIAAVTAAQPRILLLDEPFTGLDRASREAVACDALREASRRAVVVAEHRPGPLAGAASVVVRLRGCARAVA